MKSTKLFVAICGVFVIANVNAQLKVDNLGHVGIGTTYPNPDNQAHIIKNVLISNPLSDPFRQLTFQVSGSGNPLIWSTNNKISFYSPSYGQYNLLYAAGYFSVSDSTLKTNISSINNSLERLLKINPIKYSIKSTDIIEENKQTSYSTEKFGFLSQEIKRLFPEVGITKEVEGALLMEYDQIVPIVVQSIKEQQIQIENLQNELNELKNRLNFVTETENSDSETSSIIFQNQPNPFSLNTEIKYRIDPSNFESASIVVFDLSGNLLKSYRVNVPGESKIIIETGTLKPGKYIYSLLVNNKEVQTKSMIVLNN